MILTGDSVKKLGLPDKPSNVTVDYSKLEPIARQYPRVKALIDESVKESISGQVGIQQGRSKRSSVGVAEGNFHTCALERGEYNALSA